jgi:hypothetical protein
MENISGVMNDLVKKFTKGKNTLKKCFMLLKILLINKGQWVADDQLIKW